jgi:polyhydroxybutyrate depolymerase
MRRRHLPFVFVLLLAGCGPLATGSGERPPTLQPGLHEIRLQHQGRTRTARVFVPDAARGGSRLPLVLAFHGGGGNADQFAEHNGVEQVAAREGFIAVHPDGTGALGTWNATADCCGAARQQGVDDVAFTLALLDSLAHVIAYDPQRVYATGHSNGALLSYLLATRTRNRFAAIAPVAAARRLEPGDTPPPTPVLHIHSVDDPRALYEGGVGPPFPLTQHRVDHPPVDSVLAQWRAANDCAAAPIVAERRQALPSSVDAGQHAERIEWRQCASGAPVLLWKLYEVGHAWPGDRGAASRAELIGRTTQLVMAAEEAWAFFRQFRLR